MEALPGVVEGEGMPLYAFEERRPVVAGDAYVHPTAVLIGGVTVGRKCFIGAGAVLRADFADIVVGDGSNVQENCVLHVTPGAGTNVGEDVVVGHGALLHDVTIRRGAVVGMGSILLQGVVVEEKAMVAAGAVVSTGFRVPAGCLVQGIPAKVRGTLPEPYETLRRAGLALYQELPERYRRGLREVSTGGDE